jgi:hypothetical protein
MMMMSYRHFLRHEAITVTIITSINRPFNSNDLLGHRVLKKAMMLRMTTIIIIINMA